MKRTSFGRTKTGHNVDIISVGSESARCGISTYGAAIVSFEVPDKDKNMRDVVLGFDSIEAYEEHTQYMGAIIGRNGNRIGGSCFTLDGNEYILVPNEGENQLHGGKSGFDKKIWEADEIPNGVRLTLSSTHMDEGFPGNMEISVCYTLEGSSLSIEYEAVSDMDTVCNLTNHAYFNLSGHSHGSVLDHALRLNCNRFTPVADSRCIPTGDIIDVEGTPLDFRRVTRIGDRIDEQYEQLVYGSGYDHNWIVDGETGVIREAAEVLSPESGITMKVMTTSPGIQFYTGNFMGGSPTGKNGAVYDKRGALCLETQYYPDAINKQHFPQPVLKRGEVWKHKTVYCFGIVE